MKRPSFKRRGDGGAPSRKAGKVRKSALRKRRDALAAQFGELQYDLGGLVYEMSTTKTYNAEIVDGRAAQLAKLDAELAEAERLLRLEDAGAAGACPSCGALHARGAAFCWQCGGSIAESPAATQPGPSSADEPAPGAPPAPPSTGGGGLRPGA